MSVGAFHSATGLSSWLPIPNSYFIKYPNFNYFSSAIAYNKYIKQSLHLVSVFIKQYMNFELLPHVYERLQERHIPLQVLKLVLEDPQPVLIQEDGTKAYQPKVVLRNKTYLLRVFVNDSVNPVRVKLVYLTSKIDKYWSTQ